MQCTSTIWRYLYFMHIFHCNSEANIIFIIASIRISGNIKMNKKKKKVCSCCKYFLDSLMRVFYVFLCCINWNWIYCFAAGNWIKTFQVVNLGWAKFQSLYTLSWNGELHMLHIPLLLVLDYKFLYFDVNTIVLLLDKKNKLLNAQLFLVADDFYIMILLLLIN